MHANMSGGASYLPVHPQPPPALPSQPAEETTEPIYVNQAALIAMPSPTVPPKVGRAGA
ncbi:unnamed protein product, partial [Protopolystoma xenopodis]